MADLQNASELKELKDYFWQPAEILRQLMDAGNYKDYVFPIIFLRYLNDTFDEEREKILEDGGSIEQADDPDMYMGCFIPESARWQHIRETNQEIGTAIMNAMIQIEEANESMKGIFGKKTSWGNKERLPDDLIGRLVEHISSKKLTSKYFNGDELGIGYEYLLGKFADDSGHTAQEFFTNRTLITMMVECLDPQNGEDVYDPTCGSAGMLIMCHQFLKETGKDIRTFRYYGQESNDVTAAIGRMNMYIHNIKEAEIKVEDTLEKPQFKKGSTLRTFDVILANPPYSIKRWPRKMIENDEYGRNFLGVPPQSCADYVFIQHILKSMDKKTGRCAILLPHGVLFRQFEEEIRKNLIKSDLIECIIGVAPGLFYNSPMEACVMICRSNKPAERKGKILFIDAKNEYVEVDNHSNVSDENRKKIVDAYKSFKDIEHFCSVIPIEKVLEENGDLLLSLYVDDGLNNIDYTPIKERKDKWIESVDIKTKSETMLVDTTQSWRNIQ